MKLELKNIKVAASLSEETTAFTATLWVDGKPAAAVSNHGTGGCNDYHPLRGPDGAYDRSGLAAAEAYVKSLPKRKFPAEWGGGEYAPNLDTLVAELLEAAEEDRKLRRLCRTKVVLADPKLPAGEYRTLGKPYRPEWKPEILARFPGCEIVNERYAAAA